LRVDEAINKTYTRRNGAEMSISRICWDTGGIDPTIVYERSKKHGLFRVIPIKGASVYGKPVASMPRKRNKNGVYLTEIGTDTAKEQIYNRFTLTPEGDEPLTALEEENTTLRQNLATAGTRISTLENQVSELVALVRQLTGSEH
ncbi:terminase gpA endonuclease subunit, partial [Escherichia coli]|uniref:terminase gpA endonuclease subunit n=1 Tax=Escherichia coli TaxID=562 RepID=UPI0034D24FD7